MYLTKKIAGRIFLLALVVSLAACKPAPAAKTTPTVDPNAIYTAAAKTVQAQMTQDAALTPEATATEAPTETSAVPTADTTLPTLPMPGAQNTQAVAATATPLFTVAPIATQGSKPSTGVKVFQWVSNDPADGSIIEAGTKFDLVWTVKNVGTTTWTTGYSYAYFSGNKFFEKSRYNLKDNVKPGEEVKIIVDAVAPSTSGDYYTWWKLINDQGQNIGDMDVKITVVKPGETPKVTPTATAKP